MEKNSSGSRRTDIAAFIAAVVFILISVFSVNRLYAGSNLSASVLRYLVLGYDLALVLFSLALGKACGITLHDMGLSRRQWPALIPVLLIGPALCLLLPGKYSLPYFFLTLFGAISEEVCFRGLLLALTLRVTHSKVFSILSQAVLFGLLHYFSYGNLLMCLGPFACGLIFCTLRVLLPASVGLPVLVLLHWINNFVLN